MAAKAQVKPPAKPMMTDAGIKAKTGQGWDHWFKALDKAGAAKLGHHAICEILEKKLGVGPWWAQMIAVSYERVRGLRAMNQNCSGDFSVNVSKVMPVALARLFKAVAEDHARWFPRGSFVPSSQTK